MPPYSLSKPLSSNFKVRLFSVTIRTTCSGVPSGMSTSISRVSLTLAPITPDKWGDHLISYHAGVASQSGGVELD